MTKKEILPFPAHSLGGISAVKCWHSKGWNHNGVAAWLPFLGAEMAGMEHTLG